MTELEETLVGAILDLKRGDELMRELRKMGHDTDAMTEGH